MYPDRITNCFYPIGHPKIINNNFDYTLNSYFGFAKVIILPPNQLTLGVLPMTINQKLLFPLCYTCALENNQLNDCLHSMIERCLINTWTIIELKEAIKNNYKILYILEVFHYEKISQELFAPYMKTWLKLKQEASGWPQEVKNVDQQEKYITDYFENEGIQLEKDLIEKNEAKRFIAKLIVNCFWGKLAQTPNLPQTEVIRNYDQYWKIINDGAKEITGVVNMTEDIDIVSWHYVKDDFSKQGNVNLAVASHVTAYARLKLLETMKKIENSFNTQLLYFDTGKTS